MDSSQIGTDVGKVGWVGWLVGAMQRVGIGPRLRLAG